jgi:hypothetical protein
MTIASFESAMVHLNERLAAKFEPAVCGPPVHPFAEAMCQRSSENKWRLIQRLTVSWPEAAPAKIRDHPTWLCYTLPIFIPIIEWF